MPTPVLRFICDEHSQSKGATLFQATDDHREAQDLDDEQLAQIRQNSDVEPDFFETACIDATGKLLKLETRLNTLTSCTPEQWPVMDADCYVIVVDALVASGHDKQHLDNMAKILKKLHELKPKNPIIVVSATDRLYQQDPDSPVQKLCRTITQEQAKNTAKTHGAIAHYDVNPYDASKDSQLQKLFDFAFKKVYAQNHKSKKSKAFSFLGRKLGKKSPEPENNSTRSKPEP